MGICHSVKASNRHGKGDTDSGTGIHAKHMPEVMSRMATLRNANHGKPILKGNLSDLLADELKRVPMPDEELLTLTDENSDLRQQHLIDLGNALEEYGNALGCADLTRLASCVREGTEMVKEQLRNMSFASSLKLAAQSDLYADNDQVKKLPEMVLKEGMTLKDASNQLKGYDELYRNYRSAANLTPDILSLRKDLLDKLSAREISLDEAITKWREKTGAGTLPLNAQLV